MNNSDYDIYILKKYIVPKKVKRNDYEIVKKYYEIGIVQVNIDIDSNVITAWINDKYLKLFKETKLQRFINFIKRPMRN